jgi:hypothetical protein
MIHRLMVLAVGCFLGFEIRSVAQEVPAKQPQASAVLASPSRADIQKLIEQLGSGNYEERQAANNRLAEIGEPAWNALRKAAATNDDLEIRRRAGRLAQEIGKKTFIEIRHFGAGGGKKRGRSSLPRGSPRNELRPLL